MHLSFVIPVHNEAATLSPLVEGIIEHAGTADLEIILVDDGSTDGSADVMAKLETRYPTVRGVRLGAHLGKTAALKAGFEHAQGNIVFTMDSDLQDDPAEIPAFVEALEHGHDLVCGWKCDRQDPRGRVRASALFNAVVQWLFGIRLRDVNCGFKAMRGEVAKALVPMLRRDYHRLIPVLVQRAGYRVGETPVTHHPRRHGRSKYGPKRYAAALRDVALLKLETFLKKRGRTLRESD